MLHRGRTKQVNRSSAAGTPNEFQVVWGDTTLFDQINMDPFGWSNSQFLVTATTPNTVLQLAFRNDQSVFALDDISVMPVPAPYFKTIQARPGSVVLTWSGFPGVTYQVQSATDLNAASWVNLGVPVKATSDTITTLDTVTTLPQRFYRIIETP